MFSEIRGVPEDVAHQIPNTESGREAKEKEPKIVLDFWFGEHSDKDDVGALRDRFKQCDVIIPERFGHTPQVLSLFNRVSKGTMTPNEAIQAGAGSNFSEFGRALLRILYKSNKPAFFIDVDSTSFAFIGDLARKKESDRNFTKAGEFFVEGNLREAIKFMRTEAEGDAHTQREREKEMVRHLKTDLLKRLPFMNEGISKKISAGEPVRILIQLGAAHTGVHHAMSKHAQKEDSLKVERNFDSSGSSSEYQYAVPTALLRKAIFRSDYLDNAFTRMSHKLLTKSGLKEEVIEDHLIATALLHRFLSLYLYKFSNDIDEAYVLADELAKKVSYSEIQKVAGHVSKYQNGIQQNKEKLLAKHGKDYINEIAQHVRVEKYGFFAAILSQVFSRMGLSLPQSQDEYKEFMEKRKKEIYKKRKVATSK